MVRFDMCTHYHAHGEHAHEGRPSAGAGRASSSSRAKLLAGGKSLTTLTYAASHVQHTPPIAA